MASITLSVTTSPNTITLNGIKSLGAPADLVATATAAGGSPIVLGTLPAQPDGPYSLSATVIPGSYTVQVAANTTLSSDTKSSASVPPAKLTATGSNTFNVPANVVVTAKPADGGSAITIGSLTDQPVGPFSMTAEVPPGDYTLDTELSAVLSADATSSITVPAATLTANGYNSLGVPADVVVTATPAGGGSAITIGQLSGQPVGSFSVTAAVPPGDYTVDTQLTATLSSTATSSSSVPPTTLSANGENTLGLPADIVVTATPSAGGNSITIATLTRQPEGPYCVTADAPPGDYQIDMAMHATLSSATQVPVYVPPMTLTVTGVKSLGMSADLVAVATPVGYGSPITLGTLHNQPDGPYTFTATVPSGDYTVEVTSSGTLCAATSTTATVPAPAFLRAAINYNGQTYTFDETCGTDLGDYTDPQGRFVQGCIRTTNSGLPAVVVMFRRDKQAGADRSEVVFELGDMFTTATPFNMTAYTATITKGDATLAVISAPKHYWHSRWRWQSTPRPVTAAVADLIASGLLPRYDKTVAGSYTPAATPRTYTVPMDLAGIYAYMPTTGERDDIGLVTEAQAEFLCTGTAVSLASLRAQLEGSGTLPWHFRDERTGGPFDVNAYPKATMYSPNGASPYIAQTNTGITLDPAHEPSLAYLPFLLTGDPYALEELQFAATFNIVTSPYASRGSWNLGFAVRAHAWSLRTLACTATSTPDAVPSWLKPRAYWQAMLNSERDWMLGVFVTPGGGWNRSPFTGLHVMQDAGGSPAGTLPASTSTQTWMEDMEAAVLAWVVKMGHTDWIPILAWKLWFTIARTNGTSGWNRTYPVPYNMALRASPTAPYVNTIPDAWSLNVQMQPALATADNTHLPVGVDLTYPSYMQAALAMAIPYVPEAQACRDWLLAEIKANTNASHFMEYKWSIAA